MSQKITERLLNNKRHTIGYAAGKTDYTRPQAIKAAKAGTITGVKIAKGPQGPYLTSAVPGQSLYSLPTRVVAGRIVAKVAAKKATSPKSTKKA